LVLISKGKLPPALNAVAVATDADNIQSTWANNTGTGTSKKRQGHTGCLSNDEEDAARSIYIASMIL